MTSSLGTKPIRQDHTEVLPVCFFAQQIFVLDKAFLSSVVI